MAKAFWSGNRSRKIVKRIIVEGDLVLQTPAHFGSGDADNLVDMPLLSDPYEGKPLLTGASLAGALRSYLREQEQGYGKQAQKDDVSVSLFGGLKGDDTGEQSSLIVEDALGDAPGTVIRHGVRLEGDSRTAADKALYDTQLWQAGTTFRLRFELLIREGDDEDGLKSALATALTGLENGRITLGARKRRGYGEVKVNGWWVKTYELTNPDGLLDWLQHGGDTPTSSPKDTIKEALGNVTLLDSQLKMFAIKAEFGLDGSLLIRSGEGRDDAGPDMVHLHARRVGKDELQPVVSGTSLAGALRARAQKIANTLDKAGKAEALVTGMFGGAYKDREGNDKLKASRVWVKESVVENGRADLVQNRVSIDRFTGGARETALFNEQPVFGLPETKIVLEIQLVNPAPHEIGLLLLLLKDLWTGDLPLGGESSVGRGRLNGRWATLTYRNGSEQTWEISANGKRLQLPPDQKSLQTFVGKLNKHLQEEAAA